MTTPEITTVSDEEVVKRVCGGERALFELFVDRYGDRLYRTIWAVLKDQADAQDVIQDTYLSALRQLHRFAGRAQFLTWLTRIALHEAFRCLRTRRYRVALAEARGRASERTDPERQLYEGELRYLLRQTIRTLPRSDQLVLVLRDIQGLSTAEAGELLGISQGAVKTRLHRARAILRTRWVGAVEHPRQSSAERATRVRYAGGPSS